MKKTLMILMIAVTLTGLLLHTGCKKSNRYDIVGTWEFTSTLIGQSYTEIYTFSGDNRGGNVLYEGQALGTYSVTGSVFSCTLEYYDIDDDYTVEVYNGSFDHDDAMSGNFTYSVEGYQTVNGTFFADRL